MRDHAIASAKFWTGETGRMLRKLGPDHQRVAFYLFTCHNSNMIGLYYLPITTIVHEVGWLTIEGASEVLRSLGGIGFAHYDSESEHVFVVEMAAHQIGETLSRKDKRHTGVVKLLHQYRKSPFFQEFLTRYWDDYSLSESFPNHSPSQAPSKVHESSIDAPSKPGSGSGSGSGSGVHTEGLPSTFTPTPVLGPAASGSETSAGHESNPTRAHAPVGVVNNPVTNVNLGYRRVMAAYPPLPRRFDGIVAERNCARLIELHGETWDTLEARAAAYAVHCASGGISEPKFALNPENFFEVRADGPWAFDWKPIPTKAEQIRDANVDVSLQWLAEQEAKDAAAGSR